MKIATFNANSIRARLAIVKDWLENESPDVLCLQETKVQDKDFPVDFFEEAGYRIAFRGQKSYNGVAIISKFPLDGVQRHLYEGGEEEARFISARTSGMIIINAYVPQGFAPGTPKFEYKLRWLRDFSAHIKREYDPAQPLLVVGDFNAALESIDVFDPEGLRGSVGFHPDEQALMEELLRWGLVDVFRKYQPDGGHYTFWDYRIPNALKRKMGWRIDYILATKPLADQSQNAWIDTGPRMAEKPSDHTFLVAEFRMDS